MPISKCHVSGGRCGSYRAGHCVHFIPARLIGESPWGWRDGIVTAHEDGSVLVRYLHEDGAPRCWHHGDLSGLLPVGGPVLVHERFRVLAAVSGWYGVDIADGLGAVPVPEQPELWNAQVTVGIVNLATGVALATDHPPTGR